MSFRAWSMFSLPPFSLASLLQHTRSQPRRIMRDPKDSSISLKTFIVEPVAAQAAPDLCDVRTFSDVLPDNLPLIQVEDPGDTATNGLSQRKCYCSRHAHKSKECARMPLSGLWAESSRKVLILTNSVRQATRLTCRAGP